MKHHVTLNTLDWIMMDVNLSCGEYTGGTSFSTECYQTRFPRRGENAHAKFLTTDGANRICTTETFSILSITAASGKGKLHRQVWVAVSMPDQ